MTNTLAKKLHDSTFNNVASTTYVRANMKADSLPDGPTRIGIVSERNCDHCETICRTPDCIRGWMIDWILYFKRTAGGRQLAEVIELNLEEV